MGLIFDIIKKQSEAAQAQITVAEIQKADGVSVIAAVLITNSDDIPNFEVLHTGKTGEPLFKVY